MEQHRARQVGDGSDRPFRHTVLMVCVGSTEIELLLVLANVLDEGVGFESATVSQIGLHDDSVVHRHLFIGLFRSDSFDGGETNLVFDVNEARGMVHKDASSFEGACGR
jgi:hypothetical protein